MNHTWLKKIDRFAGKTLARLFPPALHLRGVKRDAPKHIAVIRLWAIGESLLALPAIRALKQAWPESEITVITTPQVEAVFRGQECVDTIHALQPRLHLRGVKWVLRYWQKFDLVIDFEPYFYVSAFLARMVGKFSIGFDTLTRGRMYMKVVPYRDDQHVVETNLGLVRLVAGDAAGGPLAAGATAPPAGGTAAAGPADRRVALAPGGRVDFRRWPVGRFADVADYLIEKFECEIVLVGDRADEPILKRVQENMKHSAQIISDLSLADVAGLLKRCRLTIANDGGLMHLSATVGTSTLGLFGPETPVRMGPYGPNNRALYHQLEDNPIINVSRGEVPGMLRAKGDLSRYVRAISVGEVIEATEEMLLLCGYEQILRIR